MGFFKKAFKGINKAVNKVGSVASKVVTSASKVVQKVANIPGVNLIPGVGTVAEIAKKAGQVAGVVGGVIASGQSPRGSSPPAMSAVPMSLAPASAQAAFDASINVGGVNASVSTGNTKQQTQEKEKTWFQKNKIVVFIGSGLVALGGLFMLFRKKNTGRRRR